MIKILKIDFNKLKKIYKIKNYQKKINKLDGAGEWRLINTEMYFSKIFNLEKNIKI